MMMVYKQKRWRVRKRRILEAPEQRITQPGADNKPILAELQKFEPYNHPENSLTLTSPYPKSYPKSVRAGWRELCTVFLKQYDHNTRLEVSIIDLELTKQKYNESFQS